MSSSNLSIFGLFKQQEHIFFKSKDVSNLDSWVLKMAPYPLFLLLVAIVKHLPELGSVAFFDKQLTFILGPRM